MTKLGFALSAITWFAVATIAVPRAAATITGTTGAALYIGANGPSNSAVPQGAGQNNTIIYAWDELQGATVASNLIPDVLAPIAAGTLVDSHLLRFDPATQGNEQGTVTFAANILGILTERASLDATDYLGSPGTLYPTHPSAAARGLEDGDFLALIAPNAIRVRWTASNPGDQIRVLTAAAVPEPGSLAMLGAGLLPLLGLRRRK